MAPREEDEGSQSGSSGSEDSLEQQLNLEEVMEMLVDYAKYLSERKKLFRAIKEIYPDMCRVLKKELIDCYLASNIEPGDVQGLQEIRERLVGLKKEKLVPALKEAFKDYRTPAQKEVDKEKARADREAQARREAEAKTEEETARADVLARQVEALKRSQKQLSSDSKQGREEMGEQYYEEPVRKTLKRLGK